MDVVEGETYKFSGGKYEGLYCQVSSIYDGCVEVNIKEHPDDRAILVHDCIEYDMNDFIYIVDSLNGDDFDRAIDGHARLLTKYSYLDEDEDKFFRMVRQELRNEDKDKYKENDVVMNLDITTNSKLRIMRGEVMIDDEKMKELEDELEKIL